MSQQSPSNHQLDGGDAVIIGDRFDVTAAVALILSDEALARRAIALFQLQVALATFEKVAGDVVDRLVITCDRELLERAYGIAAFSILLDSQKASDFVLDAESKGIIILDIATRLFREAKRNDADVNFLSYYFEKASYKKTIRDLAASARSAVPYWDFSINATSEHLVGKDKAGVSAAINFIETDDTKRSKKTIKRLLVEGFTNGKKAERKFRPLAGFFYIGFTYKLPILPVLGSWYFLGPTLIREAKNRRRLAEGFGRVLAATEILRARGYADVRAVFPSAVKQLELPPDPIKW